MQQTPLLKFVKELNVFDGQSFFFETSQFVVLERKRQRIKGGLTGNHLEMMSH